ncbi:microtubule-associated protein RP/EB family member 1-like [Anopheles bellator]|uniref:microtubule-associated protein RP/EB family member 1-like n=1 Tax=Anopheles bellator TaxID=139047 RepID=UPI0026484F5F|nr:microtubule-associated protein RP/EB family member 1-like [Anopheles bellator]
MAVNVHFTGVTMENLSRIELLAWVNRTLMSEFKKVEELCTGAAYCQLMDVLFPGCLPLKRVKFCTNVQHDFLNNLRIFQNGLVSLKVEKSVPIERLAKGRFQDNFEFLQWFKKFFDANYDGKEYDAPLVRNHVPMGYGAPSVLRPSQRPNVKVPPVALTTGKERIKSTDSATGIGKREKDDSKADGAIIDELSKEIGDLAIKMQDAEMARDYYYQKLMLVESWIKEHQDEANEEFCGKVWNILTEGSD